MKKLKEGDTSFFAVEQDIPVRKMEVFYNRKRQATRDILLKVIGAEEREQLRIAEPLAGSGITALRLLTELPKKKIKEIVLNDAAQDAVMVMKKNIALNKVSKRTEVCQQEANTFLSSQPSFDVINIDPFGTPVPFLESALRKTKRKGLLIVTATDTAALFGAKPTSCKRKYWAIPSQASIRKEIGLRILIRRIQLIGASYDKQVLPILSYTKDHYAQVICRVEGGKKRADELLKKHDYITWHTEGKKIQKSKKQQIGPLWLGALWDKKLLKKIAGDDKFLNILAKESEIDTLGFYDIPTWCSKLKCSTPSLQAVITKLREKGYKAVPSHFTPAGIRTTADEKTIKRILKLKSIREKV